MVDAVGKEVIPFEDRDEDSAEIAQFFMKISQGKKPHGIKGISISKNDEIYLQRDPIINETNIGRNEVCNCGSGKKWKKCCGKN